MAIDPKWLGVESGDRYVDIEKGRLQLFAMATGETNQIYTDDAAAITAGHPALPAPPTWVFSLGLIAPGAKNNISEMIPNIGALLHGEQDFTYHKMLYAGDRVRINTKTVDIYSKKGGKLDFIVQETTAHNQHNDLCVTARTVAVVRN
ncbi:MAG: MaoC family dehydratase N-terminal domain-containing protein [Kordiimonadaceae bacterium]|nr:MaoC family dehydratase N-terminal domain-containing protein [Kordiimonadaceae bacterium]